jgi:hypothetical protein
VPQSLLRFQVYLRRFSKKKGKSSNLLCLLSAPLREQYSGLHSSGGLGEREPILRQDDTALRRASCQAAQVRDKPQLFSYLSRILLSSVVEPRAEEPKLNCLLEP